MKSPGVVVGTVVAVVVFVGVALVVPGLARDDGRWGGPVDAMSGQAWPHGGAGGYHHASGPVDEPTYLAEMVAHHQEAVDAAGDLARSERAEMRAFGRSIVETQSEQIRQMESWLAAWYPGTAAADYEPMMRDLSQLSGDDLDRAFLEDMVGHHMAAVMSSQLLLRNGAEHQEVAELARTIRDDQHAEIVKMRLWLATWFDD